MQRRMIRIALPALSIVLVPTAAHAERAPIAPPGAASAVAVQVGELLSLSNTGAQAGPDATAAQANVVQLGGHPLLGLGGTQDSPGTSQGQLLEVGGPVHAEAAPWEASSTGTGGEDRAASSRAAVARADVPDVADVDVLEAESNASHKAARSTANGSSNGAHAGLLGALDLTVLHSETSSEGTGSSFLAGVNGLKVGTNEQLGPICGLQASPLISVACLIATGGTAPAGRTADSAVASAQSDILASLLGGPVGAISTTSSAGDGTLAAATPAPAVAPAPVVGGESAARGLPDADTGSTTMAAPGALARTGATAVRLAPLGLLLLGVGAVLRLVTRRRLAL